MIDILFSRTNLGKTSLAHAWRPNAITLGLTTVTPQVRRVLGIIPRAVWSNIHKKGQPPPGASHPQLRAGVDNDNKKYGIVRCYDTIQRRYGTYDGAIKASGLSGKRDAKKDLAHVEATCGVDKEEVGFWLVSADADVPASFSRDVIIDDAQFLCRDAYFAHFLLPKDLDDQTPIAMMPIVTNVLREHMDVGKNSKNFMTDMFRWMASSQEVNWVITTHERRGGSAETESRTGKKSTVDYNGGPEFLTSNQSDFVTGYVDNSLRVVEQAYDVELFAATPWAFPPSELSDLSNLMVHYRADNPERKFYGTKQRGPFWDTSPGAPFGLHRGTGTSVSADMTGFEWLGATVDAMLRSMPVTGNWSPAEWAEIWAAAKLAAQAEFKAQRGLAISVVMRAANDTERLEAQQRAFNGMLTGCNFVGLTKNDLTAQLRWAYHEGWAAFIARKRQMESIAEGLFE